MVFSSLTFLFIFLPICLLIYYISPRKIRNLVLFIFSLMFYSWGEPKYILLMIFSTLFNYIIGLLIYKKRQEGQYGKSKNYLIFSVIVNLGILGFFKYSNFLITNINSILGRNIDLLNIKLPIGISFYTFQIMSYVIDVYRDQVEAQRSIVDFGTYVTLFPQLVAGPIVRYSDVAYELENRVEDLDKFSYGVRRFILGLSKKVLIANNMGLLFNELVAMGTNNLTVAAAWLGAIAFTFQIYFDFSGYSDMAIGLGSMFGFRFLENFDNPYISTSITEFWRRWHISLGTWFKEYVYIPLGGSKEGRPKLLRNLFIVWFLTGLWHGASWNFIIWGLYFGVILVVEKFFLLKLLEKLPKFISHIYALFFIVVGWVIFSFENIFEGFKFFQAMFGSNGLGLIDSQTIYILKSNLVVLILAAILSLDIKGLIRRLADKYRNNKGLAALANIALVAMFIVSICFLVGDSYNPFLYFRF